MGDQAVLLGPVAECVDAERIGSPVVVVALCMAEGRRWPSAKFRAGYMMTAILRTGYGVSPCGHCTGRDTGVPALVRGVWEGAGGGGGPDA
ncbi:hypothetical protein GCM10010286_19850 [Streptomyces toxytricini]|nr:hypothetical protein GCM10010286_19850 [Streptomyces toxytricini]